METIIDNERIRILVVGPESMSALLAHAHMLAAKTELTVVAVHTETEQEAEQYKGITTTLNLMAFHAHDVADNFRELAQLASPKGYNLTETNYFVEKRSTSRKAYKNKLTTFGKAAYTEKRNR